MPTVTIDNRTIQVPNNTLVVEAARRVGIEIPVFCYHPKLAPVGMCRLCLVEVGTPKRGKDGQVEKDAQGNPVIAWMPKLQAACTTTVSDGMVVRTDTAPVAEARRAVLEFLLTSHPLDCPICDKGGECPLQNLTMAYGPGASRFPVDAKFHNDKRVPLGNLIVLDRERCIQCARCIRFQSEIADDPEIGFAHRGRGMEIVALGEPAFHSKFSGITVDICPVGALTSRDFRLRARVWELRDVQSVCAHCSVGCNLNLGTRDHDIKRVVPRENDAVNEIFVCDKGRFVHHFVTSENRLTTPLIREGADFKPVSWYDAFAYLTTRFNETKQQYGANAFGGIAGDRCANEDLYLFQKFFREVLGSPHVEHRVGWSATNVGADLVRLYGAGVGTNLGALDKNATVLVLGADPENEQPVIRLRLTKSARYQGANVIVANGRVVKMPEARASLVYRYGTEAFFLSGLIRAILDAGLENAPRVENLGELRAKIEPYTVEWVAEITGVNADAIRATARSFATARDGLILFGREMMLAQQREPAVVSALATLLLITNHIGRANSGLIALYPHNNSMGALDMGVVSDKSYSAAELLSAKTRVLWVMGADPAAHGKFSKPNLLIVQDLLTTATARLADVILPAQSFAEREGTFTNTERRVQLFRAALPPRGDAQADWWIIARLAKELGADWDYASPVQIMEEISARVPQYAGITYDQLARVDVPEYISKPVTGVEPELLAGQGAPREDSVRIAMGEPTGATSSIQWATVAESNPDAKFAIQWIEPAAPAPGEGLVLAVARSLYDRGNLVNETRLIQSRVPKPYVEINNPHTFLSGVVNAHDAEELALADGATVRVSFDTRKMDLPARVNGHVPPGVVLIPSFLDGTERLEAGVTVKVEVLQK